MERGHRRFAVADLKGLTPTLSRPRRSRESAETAVPRLADALDAHGKRIVDGVVATSTSVRRAAGSPRTAPDAPSRAGWPR